MMHLMLIMIKIASPKPPIAKTRVVFRNHKRDEFRQMKIEELFECKKYAKKGDKKKVRSETDDQSLIKVLLKMVTIKKKKI